MYPNPACGSMLGDVTNVLHQGLSILLIPCTVLWKIWSYVFGCWAGQSTGSRTNELVANPLGPGQTSALQIKTRSA